MALNDFPGSVQSLMGFELSKKQADALQIYEKELLAWNEHISLTAIRDAEGVRIKHFLDSMTVLSAWDRPAPPARLIDIGTGAGFPGLVLKIFWPATKLTLVESVHKKADFCQHIADKLNLKDVEVVPERAEVVGQDLAHRGTYDLAVARAVARMPILVEYLLPLVQRSGIAMAMKGETAHAETHAAEAAIKLMGGHLQRLVHIQLPGVVEERFIVIIHKVAGTPQEYPRRTGVPTKHPIL